MSRKTTPFEVRFWAKVDRRGDDECWPWNAYRNQGGYGWFSLSHGVQDYAHRIAYKLLVGQIPDGLAIDHLCRVRHCVNPRHMEPVTHGENIRRGDAPSIISHRTGLCKYGHSLHDARRRKNGEVVNCKTCYDENVRTGKWKNGRKRRSPDKEAT